MLYLFKTCAVNLINLPISCFYLSRTDIHDPCYPLILDDLFIAFDVSNFAWLVESNDPVKNFRNVDWTNNADALKILDHSVATKKNKVFGSHSDYQLEFLKQRYNSDAMIITHSYANNQMLVKYHALCHIYKQGLGLIPMSDWDRKLRNDNVDLVDYYTQEFAKMELVSSQQLPVGDYDIPIEDFFNQKILFDHLINLGATNLDPAADFYQRWSIVFEKHFKEKQ